MPKNTGNIEEPKRLDMTGPGGPLDVSVTMQRAQDAPTSDQLLWQAIINRTHAISFNNYKRFIDQVMCGDIEGIRQKWSAEKHQGENREEALDALEVGIRAKSLDHFYGLDAYHLLKKATELFLMQESGVYIHGPFDVTEGGPRIDDDRAKELTRELRERYLVELAGESQHEHRVLPYLKLIIDKLADLPLKPSPTVPNCYGILRSRVTHPSLMELIWSYWHEEGMLVQAMNTISLRFQNVTKPGTDPLTRFDLDPLRPLNNLLWGYIQDEMFRLTVRRRTAAYIDSYGMPLVGKAAAPLQAVENRSKFLASFHYLLNRCNVFFKDDDNTTVIADGFPLLNAIKDVHLLLAESNHNQTDPLTTTARVEMMIQQWLLARPEMREFLGGKIMVPYTEPWMDRVDTLKSMQGWSDVNVMHFRDLGVFGEQILLSIRYGDWTRIFDPVHAANWARTFRPAIKSYCYAYFAATKIDLSAEPVNSTAPGVLLRNRLALQQKSAR